MCNNKINETSVTELGIHLDRKMSMKVAIPIGHFYKLNRFLPETILKTLLEYIIDDTAYIKW